MLLLRDVVAERPVVRCGTYYARRQPVNINLANDLRYGLRLSRLCDVCAVAQLRTRKPAAHRRGGAAPRGFEQHRLADERRGPRPCGQRFQLAGEPLAERAVEVAVVARAIRVSAQASTSQRGRASRGLGGRGSDFVSMKTQAALPALR